MLAPITATVQAAQDDWIGRIKKHRAELQEAYRRWAAERADIDAPDSPYAYIHGLLDYDPGEVLADIVLALLDLPEDPWPGLTHDDMARMTKGKCNRDAPHRDLHQAAFGGAAEVDLITKILAAAHREWLEYIPEKKRRGRPPKNREAKQGT
jgi:hypothetical protein